MLGDFVFFLLGHGILDAMTIWGICLEVVSSIVGKQNQETWLLIFTYRVILSAVVCHGWCREGGRLPMEFSKENLRGRIMQQMLAYTWIP